MPELSVMALSGGMDSTGLLMHLLAEGHEVHAVLPADVPSVQPVDFVVSEVFFVTREPVAVSAVLKMLWP